MGKVEVAFGEAAAVRTGSSKGTFGGALYEAAMAYIKRVMEQVPKKARDMGRWDVVKMDHMKSSYLVEFERDNIGGIVQLYWEPSDPRRPLRARIYVDLDDDKTYDSRDFRFESTEKEQAIIKTLVDRLKETVEGLQR